MKDPDVESPVTIKDFLQFVWPQSRGTDAVPWWPPDVYALTAALLRRTGGYVRVLQLPHQTRDKYLDKNWAEHADELAGQWRESLNRFLEIP